MASPIFLDGRLYVISDTGMATCMDGKTGDMVWKKRIGGSYSSSILHAAGRLYYFSREGNTTVIAPPEGRQSPD